MSNVQIYSSKSNIRIFQKWHIELKFFSLDAYYDIKLYPSFHNQWADPNILWWRDGRKNHHRFKFRYAISIISLFQA